MKKKRHAFAFLICATLAVLLFASCAKGKVDPVGVYLTDGGRGYIEIVKDAQGNFRVGGELAPFLATGPLSGYKLSFKSQKLVFLDETKWGREDEWESRSFRELGASSTTSGDWDLIRAQWWHGLSKEKPSDDEIPLLEQPIPSYLHRVDDRRVVEYFSFLPDYREAPGSKQRRIAELDIDRLSELTTGLVESHPDDLYVRTLYLDVLLRKGDYETLEKRLSAWEETYSSAENPFVRWAFMEAENTLHARELSAEGRNAYHFITQILSPGTNLESRLELFPKILEYREYLQPRESLIFAQGHSLNYQIAMKVFLAEAEFLMLDGKPEKREEALKILAGIYHFGQLLNCSDTVIYRLIGMAIRRIACRGLRLYTLNCCKTQDEFLEFWEMLGEIASKAKEKELRESLPIRVDKKEFETRQRHADADFQLVRMATAAKYRFFTQQAFPGSAEEFAPLLPDGPPQDPFGLEQLKFFSGPESFTCYSVGPDEQDGQATVCYDPTNGTVSGGDIILEIPH